jgi:hypothetical protein
VRHSAREEVEAQDGEAGSVTLGGDLAVPDTPWSAALIANALAPVVTTEDEGLQTARASRIPCSALNGYQPRVRRPH